MPKLILALTFSSIWVYVFHSASGNRGRGLDDAETRDANLMPAKYRMTKIVHGKDVVPGEFPWMVTISAGVPRTGPPYTGYHHICGATIINTTHVVSAAHCFGSSKKFLIAGVWNITNYEESSRQLIPIKSFAKHALFSTKTGEYDIATAEGETPFVFNERVQPLRLSCPNSNPMQDKCMVMGWGRTGDGPEDHPPILQKAKIKILETEECVKRLSTEEHGEFEINKHHICVTSPCSKPQGTCGGDSGGPLVCWDGSGPYIGGLTSWGKGADCGRPESFGVFTRINSYFDFIRNNISKSHTK